MSQSSLPDIFIKSQTLPLKLHKQSPSFSLQCNNNNHQKQFSTIHKPLTQTPPNPKNSPNTKGKSLSTQHPSSKKVNLQEIQEFGLHTLMDKNRISFFQDENNRKSGLRNKQLHLGMQKNNFSLYEANRRFSNNTVQLQEADNLRSKLINQQRDLGELKENITQIRQNAQFIQKQLSRISEKFSSDLEAFYLSFQSTLKFTYNKLSLLRRQTNNQIRSNQIQLQKSQQDIHTCASFSNQLNNKTNNLYDSCFKEVQTASSPQDNNRIKNLDFQQISSIRKSSRGATGELLRGKRGTRGEKDNLIMDLKRKSANWQQFNKANKFVLNGQQIDLLNLQEEI